MTVNKWQAIGAVAAVVLIAPTTVEAATHTYLEGKEQVQKIDIKQSGTERIITFSEAVNVATIAENIQLTNVTEGAPVEIDAEPIEDGTAVKLSLVNTTYKENHQYELLIDRDIENEAGQQLQSGVKYVYETVNTGESTETEVPRVEPEKPTEPEQPVEPEKPTEPEQPVEPEKPTEPEQPVEPEKPTAPENPLSFENEAHVLRQYDMGNDIAYYVMKHEGAKNYELQITINNELVGGYYAVDNSTMYGYTIGEKNPAQLNHKQFKLIPLIDEHGDEKNKAKHELIGFAYTVKNYSNYAKLNEAMSLTTSPNLSQVAQVYADLANDFRTAYGVAPLTVHDVLAETAKNHSTDMATHNYFSHVSLTGKQPWDRIDEIQPNLWSNVGENIAAGSRTIFEAHIMWLNSAGHRQNIVDANFTHIGYGAAHDAASKYNYYHTTKFIKLKK